MCNPGYLSITGTLPLPLGRFGPRAGTLREFPSKLAIFRAPQPIFLVSLFVWSAPPSRPHDVVLLTHGRALLWRISGHSRKLPSATVSFCPSTSSPQTRLNFKASPTPPLEGLANLGRHSKARRSAPAKGSRPRHFRHQKCQKPRKTHFSGFDHEQAGPNPLNAQGCGGGGAVPAFPCIPGHSETPLPPRGWSNSVSLLKSPPKSTQNLPTPKNSTTFLGVVNKLHHLLTGCYKMTKCDPFFFFLPKEPFLV